LGLTAGLAAISTGLLIAGIAGLVAILGITLARWGLFGEGMKKATNDALNTVASVFGENIVAMFNGLMVEVGNFFELFKARMIDAFYGVLNAVSMGAVQATNEYAKALKWVKENSPDWSQTSSKPWLVEALEEEKAKDKSAPKSGISVKPFYAAEQIGRVGALPVDKVQEQTRATKDLTAAVRANTAAMVRPKPVNTAAITRPKIDRPSMSTLGIFHNPTYEEMHS